MLGVGIWEGTPPRRRAIDTGQEGPRLADNVLKEEQETDPTIQCVFLSAPLAFEKGRALKTAACAVAASWGVESSSIPVSREGLWVGHCHGRDQTC